MAADDGIPYLIEIEGPARIRVRARDEDSRMVKQASEGGWIALRPGAVLTLYETTESNGQMDRHNVIRIRGV
jgi:hypothetical protein